MVLTSRPSSSVGNAAADAWHRLFRRCRPQIRATHVGHPCAKGSSGTSIAGCYGRKRKRALAFITPKPFSLSNGCASLRTLRSVLQCYAARRGAFLAIRGERDLRPRVRSCHGFAASGALRRSCERHPLRRGFPFLLAIDVNPERVTRPGRTQGRGRCVVDCLPAASVPAGQPSNKPFRRPSHRPSPHILPYFTPLINTSLPKSGYQTPC
jgi:hypothetical protein